MLSSLEESGEAAPANGAFEMAGERLETLLKSVRSNHDSLLDEVEGYSPDQRLTLLANCGALVTAVAFVACFIGREDPMGGMTLTPSSLEAAAQGLLFGLPLLACSAAGHSRAGRAAFPVLEELHSEQRKQVAPMITGMSVGHLGVLFGFLVVPCLLFLLPTYKAGWDAFEGFLSSAVLSPSALFTALPSAGAVAAAADAAPRIPPELGMLVPSILSAYTAGFVVASCLSVREWELEALSDALKSAERYFRLAISERRGASAPASASASCDEDGDVQGGGAAAGAAAAAAVSSEVGGRSAARAFRLVTTVWLLQRFQVSRLGFVLTSLNTAYYFVMWQSTDDLATPAAAALLHCAVECYFSASEQREVDVRHKAKLEQVQLRVGVRSSRVHGGGGSGSNSDSDSGS